MVCVIDYVELVCWTLELQIIIYIENSNLQHCMLYSMSGWSREEHMLLFPSCKPAVTGNLIRAKGDTIVWNAITIIKCNLHILNSNCIY